MSSSSVHEIILNSIIEKQRVPHLMLFAGHSLTAMRKSALDFAKKWLASITPEPLRFHDSMHPDIHFIATEGKLSLHSIASIRQMTEKMAYSPYAASGKVFIVENAERMLPTSANALLKSLEEPLGQTVIILTSTREEQLLATIRSRCVKIAFHEKGDLVLPKTLHAQLLEILRMPADFFQIAQAARELSCYLDEKKKLIMKEVQSFFSATIKEMNVQQKQKVELEIDGAVSAKWFDEVDHVLCAIFELFRDRVALNHGVEADHLFHSGDAGQLPLMPLEKVDAALSFARLSIEKATPLCNVFEALFLKFRFDSNV